MLNLSPTKISTILKEILEIYRINGNEYFGLNKNTIHKLVYNESMLAAIIISLYLLLFTEHSKPTLIL